MASDWGEITQDYTLAMKCDRPKQVFMKDVHPCLTKTDVAADRAEINYILQLEKQYFISNYMI